MNPQEIIRRDKFGKWTVLGDAPDKLYRTKKGCIVRWRYLYCECACGVRKEVNLNSLQHTRSTQCQTCGNKSGGLKKRKYDLKKNYGSWTVLFNYISKRYEVYCECRCKCGTTKFVKRSSLRDGFSTQCRSCGSKKSKKRVISITPKT